MSSIEERLDRIERMTLLAAKDVFTVEDLALYIGKSEKTIRNSVDNIPHYKNALGQLTFKRDEINAWQCSVKCTTINL